MSCTLLNSLWPSDIIWQQGSRSTLAQVMACCLTAPSHYLNQYWLIISKVQWHSSEGNFTKDASGTNHWNYFKNYLSKILFKYPRGQWISEWNSSCNYSGHSSKLLDSSHKFNQSINLKSSVLFLNYVPASNKISVFDLRSQHCTRKYTDPLIITPCFNVCCL